MWPRYPKVASRVSRWRATVATSRQENGRRGNWCGPSRYPAATSTADASAAPEASTTTVRIAVTSAERTR